jgi:hypothetical protein
MIIWERFIIMSVYSARGRWAVAKLAWRRSGTQPLAAGLADSSVWVAHFRKSNGLLQSLLATDQVLCHPLIVLELACGTPPAPRGRTLGDLKKFQGALG